MGADNVSQVNSTDRLRNLRLLMSNHDIDCYVIPSEDAHSSEYIDSTDARRAWISGFTGSAGLAIIHKDKALMWADGRYHLQASQQLDSNWTLMKWGLPGVPTPQEYMVELKDTTVGIDPHVFAFSEIAKVQSVMRSKGSKIVPVHENLVDQVWGSDKPKRTCNEAFVQPEKYAGEDFTSKLQKMREELKEADGKALVISMLDEVAWLFNLRGSDISYNPVFFAYAIITGSETILFIDNEKVTDAVHKHLNNQVTLKPYDQIVPYFRSLSMKEGEKVVMGTKTSWALATAVGEDKVKLVSSPVNEYKAIKNEVELEGFRQSHIRDGAALVAYFAWLEEQLKAGATINECQGADKLEEFRSKQALFKGLSFDTISSTGPNGAIIHYKPEPETCAKIDINALYLCDSGAQYLDGTTDVTRTLHFGTPTEDEKRTFTRVLQGHIAIDTMVWEKGMTGYTLDALARAPLWKDGLSYAHGTGHGVGSFLNVHEGPAGISNMRITCNDTPLKAGMVMSNEPGVYFNGKYGIRIESLVIVKDAQTRYNHGGKGYLAMEHVTLCPIQTSLVELELLTKDERKWLNEYHQECLEKLTPLLKDDQRALDWLKRECSSI